MRQILARSKRTLMMSQNKWTDIQRHRINILFKHHPILRRTTHRAHSTMFAVMRPTSQSRHSRPQLLHLSPRQTMRLNLTFSFRRFNKCTGITACARDPPHGCRTYAPLQHPQMSGLQPEHTEISAGNLNGRACSPHWQTRSIPRGVSQATP